MFNCPDHPEIESALRTGYPSWLNRKEEEASDDETDE